MKWDKSLNESSKNTKKEQKNKINRLSKVISSKMSTRIQMLLKILMKTTKDITQVGTIRMLTMDTIMKKERTRQKMDKCTMDIMTNKVIGLTQAISNMIKASIKDIGTIMDNGLTQVVKPKIKTMAMMLNLTII